MAVLALAAVAVLFAVLAGLAAYIIVLQRQPQQPTTRQQATEAADEPEPAVSLDTSNVLVSSCLLNSMVQSVV